MGASPDIYPGGVGSQMEQGADRLAGHGHDSDVPSGQHTRQVGTTPVLGLWLGRMRYLPEWAGRVQRVRRKEQLHLVMQTFGWTDTEVAARIGVQLSVVRAWDREEGLLLSPRNRASSILELLGAAAELALRAVADRAATLPEVRALLDAVPDGGERSCWEQIRNGEPAGVISFGRTLEQKTGWQGVAWDREWTEALLEEGIQDPRQELERRARRFRLEAALLDKAGLGLAMLRVVEAAVLLGCGLVLLAASAVIGVPTLLAGGAIGLLCGGIGMKVGGAAFRRVVSSFREFHAARGPCRRGRTKRAAQLSGEASRPWALSSPGRAAALETSIRHRFGGAHGSGRIREQETPDCLVHRQRSSTSRARARATCPDTSGSQLN